MCQTNTKGGGGAAPQGTPARTAQGTHRCSSCSLGRSKCQLDTPNNWKLTWSHCLGCTCPCRMAGTASHSTTQRREGTTSKTAQNPCWGRILVGGDGKWVDSIHCRSRSSRGPQKGHRNSLQGHCNAGKREPHHTQVKSKGRLLRAPRASRIVIL